jgi:cyclase
VTVASPTGPRWRTGMREVGADVFAYVQATGETGISNAGLIIGAEGATAVDALMVPSMTRRLVAAIRKTTPRKIGALVNTHHHLDHTGGNRFFRGATIIATERCRQAMAPGFPPVPLLQRFMPAFAHEFPLLKLQLPTVTFADRLVLHDGHREIHLWHPGRPAHTVGDATVFLPKERVLFAGDLAFHYVTPLAFQGHVGHWIEAADRVLALEADVIVPGHGPIGTRQDVRLMRDYLALVRREARVRFDAGMSEEAAARDIKLGAYASWREAERILPNVMRCYQEFRDETDRDLDIPRMLEGMERLRGARAAHACL